MIRALAVLGACTLLAACATTAPGDPNAGQNEHRGLRMLAESIPGEYVAAGRSDRQGSPIRLLTEAHAEAPGELLIELSQRQSGSPRRDFILALESTSNPDRLAGRFMPVVPDSGTQSMVCQMGFVFGPDGLVGETDPGQCRFGEGEAAVGLLKEILFDGGGFRMADQLVSAGGDALADPEILHFRRVGHFRGTAARQDGGVDWRVSEDVRILTGLDLVEPLDAAGMSLGIVLNLEMVRPRESDNVLLRLQVLDADESEVLAQVWADPDATMIGLGLTGLRVDLRREP
ncbi:MAG: hypothetical protein EA419_08710 [Wenzhouxiangella sp.]|nr:MAG: hypothetical protein EA419_08710 [Wenzhouxiangella sp.]